jgi:hypothetical protein
MTAEKRLLELRIALDLAILLERERRQKRIAAHLRHCIVAEILKDWVMLVVAEATASLHATQSEAIQSSI